MKALLITICLLFSISSLHGQCLAFETLYSFKDKNQKDVYEGLKTKGWTCMFSNDLSPFVSVWTPLSDTLRFYEQIIRPVVATLFIECSSYNDSVLSISRIVQICPGQTNYSNFLKTIKQYGFKLKYSRHYKNEEWTAYVQAHKKYPTIIINKIRKGGKVVVEYNICYSSCPLKLPPLIIR